MMRTPPQGIINIADLKPYGNRFVRALGHRLLSGIEPACLLLQGDSTSNDSDEWFPLTMQWLASKFPAYTVAERIWMDATQSYSEFTVPYQTGSAGEAYATIPASANHGLYAPNSTALQITGDIDIAIKLTMTNWSEETTRSLVSKLGDAPNRGWAFIMKTTRELGFWWSENGTDLIGPVYSTVAPTVVNGTPIWLRVTLDVDNGAGGYDLKFYTSSNGNSWTQLGTTVVGGSTTSIHANTENLHLGNKTMGASSPWEGKIYAARVKNSINGAVVASPSLGQAFPSGSTFTDAEGNTWTKNSLTTVGNGSPEMLVLNASAPGQAIAYSTNATRFALQAAKEPQLTFINYSHNEGTTVDYQSVYEGLCTQLLTKWPNVGVVCVTQNPEQAPAVNIVPHAQRNRRIATLAAKNNYGLIDAYRAFVETGNYSALVNASDGIHPTGAGSRFWKNVAIKFLESAII